MRLLTAHLDAQELRVEIELDDGTLWYVDLTGRGLDLLSSQGSKALAVERVSARRVIVRPTLLAESEDLGDLVRRVAPDPLRAETTLADHVKIVSGLAVPDACAQELGVSLVWSVDGPAYRVGHGSGEWLGTVTRSAPNDYGLWARLDVPPQPVRWRRVYAADVYAPDAQESMKPYVGVDHPLVLDYLRATDPRRRVCLVDKS